ncbi:hypothetical protein C6501_12235 [Candidatus Poribacteria bacterium]|nr:MAG: hypothetical protein C6501_12235 [Candidatus Poribacteria bacterium]
MSVENYEYEGKHLNQGITQGIIKDWFKVRGSLTQITQCVLIEHVKQGGLTTDPHEITCRRDLDFIVRNALSRLQRDGCAIEVSREDDTWEISGKPPCVYDDGKGNEFVYLFYDHYQRYIMDDRWECYIGQTGDLQKRMYNHARKLRVEPTVALEFKTKDSRHLERQIRHVLKRLGRCRTDKKGISWYDTSPDEVVFVYKYIKKCEKLNALYDELTSLDGLNRDELKDDVFEL